MAYYLVKNDGSYRFGPYEYRRDAITDRDFHCAGNRSNLSDWDIVFEPDEKDDTYSNDSYSSSSYSSDSFSGSSSSSYSSSGSYSGGGSRYVPAEDKDVLADNLPWLIIGLVFATGYFGSVWILLIGVVGLIVFCYFYYKHKK